MRLRDISNYDICHDNGLLFTYSTNVVEEHATIGKIRSVLKIIAKVLCGTLGPYGSTTIIQDRQGHHFASKDGYDLMNRINFDDEVGRTILDIIKQVASNQVLTVGDGSTSAIIVANALFDALVTNHDTFKNVPPKDIVDILNDIATFLTEDLKKMAVPVSEDLHEIDTIAAISTNNDKELGKTIADIYRKIGKDGFISTDVVKAYEKDVVEIKHGIEIQRGYVDEVFGRFFEGKKVIYDNDPNIILFNYKLTQDDLKDILVPLMQAAHSREDVSYVIVANQYDYDVMNFLKTNRTKHLQVGGKYAEINFTAVDIEQVTDRGRHDLEDIAFLCGCEVFDKYKHTPADIVKNPNRFIGQAEKIVATEKSTQFIFKDFISPDHENKKKKKIEYFKEEIANFMKLNELNADQDFDLYENRRRLANMTDSTAIFHVGGKMQTERQTRERLIEDAIFACKSALKYGFIPGGNLMIPYILNNRIEAYCDTLGTKYNYLKVSEGTRMFFMSFMNILKNAFIESYRNVLSNSLMTEEQIEETIKKCIDEKLFYNLKNHEYEKFEETSVINSVDTDIQILKSCISIISILATSNQFITLNFNIDSALTKQ